MLHRHSRTDGTPPGAEMEVTRSVDVGHRRAFHRLRRHRPTVLTIGSLRLSSRQEAFLRYHPKHSCISLTQRKEQTNSSPASPGYMPSRTGLPPACNLELH